MTRIFLSAWLILSGCSSSHRADDPADGGRVLDVGASDSGTAIDSGTLDTICADYMPPPPAFPMCRDTADCEAAEICVSPGVRIGCGGPCMMPIRECATERFPCMRADGSEGRCVVHRDPCICGEKGSGANW